MKQESSRTRTVITLAFAALVAAALCAFTSFGAQQAFAAESGSSSSSSSSSTAEMLDPSHTGSITVSPVSADDKSVSGTFELYLVATPVADNTGWHFQWTDAYQGTDSELYNKTGDLDDSYKKQLVGLLQDKVSNPLATASVQSGTATFSSVQPGLYLLKMSDVESGYDAVEPFLVSVPTQSGNALVYNVDASPKAGTVSATPATPTNNGETPANDTRLPQTGQLWWPVFALLAAGAICIAAGMLRRRTAPKAVAATAE